MPQAAIQYSKVFKHYGVNSVLEGVDLRVEAGEFFGLVGLNGAGKTTMIKSLLDFCSIDAGGIEVFGRSSTEPGARQRLAFLPERFAPPYHQTGREFLQFMADMMDVELPDEQLGMLLEALDLDADAMQLAVRRYSKGMAQKLGLAACLLSGRSLLVLDEPMSGLDPKARKLLKQQLLHLRDSGQSLFFSTHLLTDVEELCDRMAILHDGQIRFSGTPQECCQHFASYNLEQAFLNCIEAAPVA